MGCFRAALSTWWDARCRCVLWPSSVHPQVAKKTSPKKKASPAKKKKAEPVEEEEEDEEEEEPEVPGERGKTKRRVSTCRTLGGGTRNRATGRQGRPMSDDHE